MSAQIKSQSDYMDFCCSEIEKSDIFVCFLGSSTNQRCAQDMLVCSVHVMLLFSVKMEVEHAYLNNPNLRPAIFVFYDCDR